MGIPAYVLLRHEEVKAVTAGLLGLQASDSKRHSELPTGSLPWSVGTLDPPPPPLRSHRRLHAVLDFIDA